MKKPWSYIPILLTAALILVTAGVYRLRNSPDAPPVPETVLQVRDHTGLLDINAAEESQFIALPGIGQTLARRIIEYRDAHGPFRSVAELLQVEGIGQGKLEAILDLITVGG